MTFVVTESCIRCRYTDCVEVCPVDCFYAGESMLVISPDKCIDCGACAPECPVNAILPDTDEDAQQWLSINTQYAAQWPGIRRKAPPHPQADLYRDETSKYAKYFSPLPDPAPP